MAATHAETITESHILTSYLLPPSPLPTVLPYNDFIKTCVPAHHRAHPHLRRLYTDLQFQRNIDIDSVRQNIDREALSKAPGLRARLARAVAEENGISSATTDARNSTTKPDSRKRKRGRPSGTENIDLELKDEPSPSDDDEFNNVLAHAVDHVYDATNQHPAEAFFPRRSTGNGVSAMHTTDSLLVSMSAAATSLEQEIAELERQSEAMLAQMQETVGGLSDLRYGKLARVSETDGKTTEQGIVDALEELDEACAKVRQKTAGSS